MPALATNTMFDLAEVEQALRLLTRPGQVFEIRAIKAPLRGERRRGIVVGYFKCPATAAKALQALTSSAGVYVTLNVVDPSLHARAYDRLRLVEDRDPTTSDANTVSRTWLLIDIDYERPANISATDAQHDAALGRAEDIRQGLIDRGWPDSVVADSGNGGHVLVAVDLPADDQGLIGRVLEALNKLFGGDGLKIDCSVSNAARITKLPGTLVCKGDNTPDRPHRMSRLRHVPDEIRPVSRELLDAVLDEAGGDDTDHGEHQKTAEGQSHAGGKFSIEEFVKRHFPEAKSKKSDKGELWLIDCPWNDEHRGAAHIIKRSDGMLSFACKHDSCKGKNWRALRDLKEPNRPRPAAFVSKVSSSRKDSQKIEWSAPRPLPNELPPVEPFDLVLLPTEFRAWIADIAERMQCPPDFPAVGSMVVAAGLLGRRVGIRPKRYDDWLVVANLWSMVIGRPGIMKTAADHGAD